jgi:hypothetical protein
MDVLVELDQNTDTSLLIGNWEDLEYLVELLDSAFEAYEYRLEKVPGGEEFFLFVEDPVGEDEYECGIVRKVAGEAYAFSDDVHKMIFSAYQRYVDEFGEPELAA